MEDSREEHWRDFQRAVRIRVRFMPCGGMITQDRRRI